MGVLINNVVQTGNKRESEQLGGQLVKGHTRTIRHKLTQSRAENLLQNILGTFSRNTLQPTFMAGRNEIPRSYPILSNRRYPNTLVVIALKREYSSCAVRMLVARVV